MEPTPKLSQMEPIEKRYQLPLCGVVLSESEIWGKGPKPDLLRPEDLEKRYGIPKASVYDMVYKAPETPDPLPFLKLERKTLVPRAAFEAWILRQAHAVEITKEPKP